MEENKQITIKEATELANEIASIHARLKPYDNDHIRISRNNLIASIRNLMNGSLSEQEEVGENKPE